MRFAFLRQNARWLAAGGLLTFGSSFGQTYFIALYAGHLRETFALSHGAWGTLYALGTLASAIVMLLVGGLVDRFRIRPVTLIVLAVFAVTAFLMARVSSVWLLPILIFSLRFCGQGLMSHLSVVATVRWFAARRGRALSITAMGFSAGEALLPFTFVALAGAIGWRASWDVAAVLLLLLIPVFAQLLRSERAPRGESMDAESLGSDGRVWTRAMALRHWLFWMLIPGLLSLPIFATAFFFQQVHLTGIKGWSLAAFTALIPVYTGGGLAGLLYGGSLVDRIGAARLMPLYLVPMALGFLGMAAAPSLILAVPALLALGLSHGLSAVTLGAVWAELYGTRHIGAIRAVTVAIMVFATALGPMGTGFLIDAGVDYRLQLVFMAAYALAASLVSHLALSHHRRRIETASAISAA